MVQRKVSKKLGIEPKNTIKTEKMHVTLSPYLQYYDDKGKVADMKASKMKKSRLIKYSDVEFAFGSSRETPGEPPTVVTTKTPSPKKLTKCNKFTHVSPNYMKGTNSSEARVNVLTTLKLHKVGNSLTKSSGFKHTRNAVLCKNVEAERATCSSTLKDSKFPSYLTLTPGATEAEGTSVMRVCPYKYCSLNGHHHRPALPLKAFISSRRRLLKTLKIGKPEVFSPGKRKRSEIKVSDKDSKKGFILSSVSRIPDDQKDDFFVDIHVPGKDFQDDADLSGKSFGFEENTDDKFPSTPSECNSIKLDPEMDSDSSGNQDQPFGEISDMEWEEGQITEFHDEKGELPVEKDHTNDEPEPEPEPGFELFEKFLAEKLLPYIPDEIMELLQFSDADTLSDSDFSLTEDDFTEEQVEDDKSICTAKLGEDFVEEQDTRFSNPFAEVTKASDEDLDSFMKQPDETDGDYLDNNLYTNDATSGTENKEIVCAEEQIPMADDGCQTNEAGNKEYESLSISTECQEPEETILLVENIINCVTKPEQNETKPKDITGASSTISDQDYDSNEIKLRSFENYTDEVKGLQTEEINPTEEELALPNIRQNSQQVQKGSFDIGNDSIDELQETCNKFKRSVRCRKPKEESDEEREFNPRPPNFLPLEPEPEPEKVDLRHQDMDERRNAEEWMLDHALQKSVNHLATARKKKVALLVEAFESVLPMPKYEPPSRRNSSCFSQARPIQACR